MITLIAAVSSNNVIGNENTIPWHIPEDFKHFKKTTMGKTIVMGSATWDSLPIKPLPNRINVIISRNRNEDIGFWVNNITDAIEYSDDVFVIGGQSIYNATIDKADKLIISRIPIEVQGDTFFPEIGKDWELSNTVDHSCFVVEYWDRIK